MFFCFKQLTFESLYQLIDGEVLLPLVVGIVSFSVNKPLDFFDTSFSVSVSLFRV